MNKDFKIWNEELKKELLHYPKNMTIGFIGALGAHDIGDEAMLISNIEKIKKIKGNDVNFKIFSMNPKNTDSYLKIKSLPFTYTFLSKGFFYRVCSLVDRFIQKPFMKDGKYIDFFSEVYALGWFFINILFLKSGITFGRYKKHTNEIKNLDVVYIIGGAYINSWHVKSRIYPFFLEIIIANKYNKNVIMSGLNLGPLNKMHRFFLRYFFAYPNVRLIGFRDWNQSLAEIGDNSRLKDKVYFSHDDAFYLDYNKEINPYEGKKYIVMQAHYWIASKKNTIIIKKLYKDIIEYAAENNLDIVMISMQSYKNNNDYKFSKEVFNSIDEKYTKHIFIPEEIYPPKVLKKIVSDAKLLLSTRHHPFLFAVSTNVFAVGISYDIYYTQKFQGIANSNCKIFSIEDDEKISQFCKKEIGLIK